MNLAWYALHFLGNKVDIFFLMYFKLMDLEVIFNYFFPEAFTEFKSLHRISPR